MVQVEFVYKLYKLKQPVLVQHKWGTESSMRQLIDNINTIAKTQLTQASINELCILLPFRREPTILTNLQTRSYRLEPAARSQSCFLSKSSHQNLTLTPVKPTFDNSAMKTHGQLPSYPVTPSLYMTGGFLMQLHQLCLKPAILYQTMASTA